MGWAKPGWVPGPQGFGQGRAAKFFDPFLGQRVGVKLKPAQNPYAAQNPSSQTKKPKLSLIRKV